MAETKKEVDPNVITGERPADDGPVSGEDQWLAANPLGEDDSPHEAPPGKGPEPEGAETHPADDRPRDEHGRFTKTDAQGSEDTAEPTASADSVNPEDYRKALNALKRDHTPQSVLDSLDPAQTVEWGLKLAGKQAETDGFGRQVSDLKAELAKLAGTDSKDAEPALDLKAKMEPIREYLGDEVAEPLEALLEPILRAATSAKDSAQAEKLEKLAAQITDREQRDARRELQEKHPEFKVDNDGRWQQTLDHRRGDTNEYPSELEALSAACRHVFADEIIADYKAKLQETHDLRDNGQPSGPSGPTPPAVETDAALEDRWLNAAHDGNKAEMDRVEALIKSRQQPGYLSFEELMTKIG
jgi:hypothetical protein